MKQELMPEITSMTPSQLITWCRGRKQTLGLSNQKLSEISGVPVGTIDRIMSGNYTEFKYSSIQPLISVLVGYGKETPEPNEDSEQEQYYYETIEGYKLILENKNNELDHLRFHLQRCFEEIEYLKKENIAKHEMIEKMSDHIKWMESKI